MNALEPVRLTRRVLVVDDEVEEMREFVRNLEAEGIPTLITDSAESALTIALEHRPALIIADLDMPGKSGHELLEDLSRHQETRHIFVILFHTHWEIDSKLINAWSKPTPSGRTADAHWVKPANSEWVTWVQNLLPRILRMHAR